MIRNGQPPIDGEIDVADLLSRVVVVSVGRGGQVQAAVDRAVRAAGGIVLARTSWSEVIRMLDVFVPNVVVTEVVAGDDAAARLLEALEGRLPNRGGGLPVVGVSSEACDPASLLRAGFRGALVGSFDALDVARAILRAVRRRR